MAKVFKKLTIEEATPSLPVWNGTDLIGTSWKLHPGWTATAGYGKFSVEHIGSNAIPGVGTMKFALYVGYMYPKLPNIEEIAPYENRAVNLEAVVTNGEPKMHISNWIYNDDRYYITFYGGEDINNVMLINWLLENGELTSHQMPTDSQ